MEEKEKDMPVEGRDRDSAYTQAKCSAAGEHDEDSAGPETEHEQQENVQLNQDEIASLVASMHGQGEEIAAEEKKHKEKHTEKGKSIYGTNDELLRTRTFSKAESELIMELLKESARGMEYYLQLTFKREDISVSVEKIDKSVYEELIEKLTYPTFAAIIKFELLKDESMLVLSPGIDKMLADRLMGGLSVLESQEDEDSELTEIEVNILKKASGDLVKNFHNVWKTLMGENVLVERVETIPRLFGIATGRDEMVVIKFGITAGDKAVGTLQFCLPYLRFKPIIENLYMQQMRTYQTDESRRGLLAILLDVPLTLRVEFNPVIKRMHEMQNMQTGDILVLNNASDEPLEIKVEEIPVFLCKPGNIKNKMGMKIIKEVKDA